MEISNFEADVLETQAKLGKMLVIFVISISKLTKTSRSDGELREAYSDSLLVRSTPKHTRHPKPLTPSPFQIIEIKTRDSKNEKTLFDVR